jgi:NCAIR mutase (PurE)-related protein
MNKKALTELLTRVAEGRLKIEDAQKKLEHLEFENIDFAQIDHHR